MGSDGTADGAGTAIPVAWWVYTVGVLLVAFSAYFSDSIARYAMAAFPLFAAFAWRLRARAFAAVVTVMALAQAGSSSTCSVPSIPSSSL